MDDSSLDDVVGTVGALTVYPVKSLGGRAVEAIGVAPDGLTGDRAWVVVDAATGERVPARQAPALAGVAATGDVAADAGTLTAALGRPVQVVPATGPAAGTAAVHLVSRGAVRRAAAGQVPPGCSADDPRANLLLDTDEDERAWVGRTLAVGTAVLHVTRTPKHCLGVYAEVLEPGRVAVGDPVRLRS